jgi:hypothetical protein
MDHCCFIDQPPVVEIRGEVAIIRHACRCGDAERANPVSVLTRYMERGQRALRQHAAGEAHTIVDD